MYRILIFCLLLACHKIMIRSKRRKRATKWLTMGYICALHAIIQPNVCTQTHMYCAVYVWLYKHYTNINIESEEKRYEIIIIDILASIHFIGVAVHWSASSPVNIFNSNKSDRVKYSMQSEIKHSIRCICVCVFASKIPFVVDFFLLLRFHFISLYQLKMKSENVKQMANT